MLDDRGGTIRLRGAIERADVEPLCTRASRTIRARPGAPLTCDAAGLERAALPTVDVLARLALAAQASRRQMRLEHASPEILELLGLCGLARAVGAIWAGEGRAAVGSNLAAPADDDLGVEPRR
jgi:ABC-type transporter Mla MlaB component